MLFSPTCHENEEGDAAVKLALASPDKFVLKPQREGGGKLYKMADE